MLEALDQDVDGILIIPFFEEGGRFTAGDIHYVEEEGGLVPAGETEYARDASFGYRSSNLRHWVCEKYQQRVNIEDVASISLELVRRGGPPRWNAPCSPFKSAACAWSMPLHTAISR